MHLKKLSLLGFKSFPEHTEVEFGPGMTGVVGPNGCGKTNILDALRWVLGEQRSSAMRSTKMDEVIFNGSRDAKPLGMAEVSLTIANSRGLLPTEYTDLTITRRLYRSGDSEYLMNRQPCRLRDILDLFAGTGMGAHSYSVIQQDMIEAVISEKPEERRFLFDEAAGVTKFKHRKRAALRKLEATDGDLVRLKDIAAEVRTRVNSLHRQSNKARRYHELKAQWEELHLRLARTDVLALQERVRTQTARSENLRGDLEAVRARVAAAEAQRDALSVRAGEHEEQVEVARLALSKCEQELAALVARREKAGALGKSLGERLTEMQAELELQSARKRDLEHRLRELESELYSAQAEFSRARELSGEQDKKRAQSEEFWQAARSKQSEAGKSFETASARKRDLETELVHTETSLVSLCEGLAESEAAVARCEAERSAAQAALATLEERERSAQSALDAEEARLSQARTAREEARVQLQKGEEELAATHSASAEMESRRSILEKWLTTYEGYSGAVSHLLAVDPAPGLLDTVAHSISAKAGYELAVAAALGERAEFILCKDSRAADEALTRLEASRSGRATLLILDELPEAEADRTVQGGTPLFNCLDVEPRLEKLARFLLQGYFVWTDPGQPESKALSSDRTWVTTTGRIYRGRVEAAAGAPRAAALIDSRNELGRLSAGVQEAAGRTETKRTEVARFASQLEACTRKVAEHEQTLQSTSEQFRQVSLEAERARARVEAALSQQARERQLHTSLLERVDQSRRAISRLKERRGLAESEFVTLGAKHTESEVVFEESERARTDAIMKAGEAQIKAVSAQGKSEGLANDAERTREMRGEVENRIAHLLAQITESGETRRALAGELAACMQESEAAEARRVERESAHRTLREGGRDLLTSLHEREKEVKEARRIADQAATNHHDAEMAASEARLEVTSLVDRIRDAHGVDITTRSDLETVEAGQRGLLALEVEELRGRIDGMGTVNLLALEEYEEQNTRLEFLDRQLADLEEARTTLLDTITRINLTARQQFEETFRQVEANFSSLFEQLFEGGQAKVTLDLPEDPLESPISVMARPRGKKPVTILQLSGGERALTAIALLFSLYMVKPSPFCILDEIDAPLDDANIGRFLSMLQRFATNTQFIIITHNKMTMEAVDILYGVTMQNPGISRVVSVKLNEALEPVETPA